MKLAAPRTGSVKAAIPRMSSVAKALLVLECVGLSERRTLTEIAKEVGLPKSTLLRLVSVLTARGFLRRTAHGEYAVSLKMWQIGCAAFNAEAIRDEVIPLLRGLVDRTGETAHYAAYEDGCSVYVEKVDGLHPIRSYTAVGGRSPAYATATGKALLAWRDEREIAEVGRAALRMDRGDERRSRRGLARSGRDAAPRLRGQPRRVARVGMGNRCAGFRSSRKSDFRRRHFRPTGTSRAERRSVRGSSGCRRQGAFAPVGRVGEAIPLVRLVDCNV